MSEIFSPSEKGSTSNKKTPNAVIEFLIAKDCGWTLEYIRNLDNKDYETISLCVQIYEKLQNIKEMAKMRMPSIM